MVFHPKICIFRWLSITRVGSSWVGQQDSTFMWAQAIFLFTVGKLLHNDDDRIK